MDNMVGWRTINTYAKTEKDEVDIVWNISTLPVKNTSQQKPMTQKPFEAFMTVKRIVISIIVIILLQKKCKSTDILKRRRFLNFRCRLTRA